jgi:DNA-binding response OmpR family regulator
MSSNPVALHILVVEDNDGLREATVSFLNANGHSAAGVDSAEEVDDTPLRDIPDLYLIDVTLPGEDGFSLAQRVRASQPLVGIVLITARGQLTDRLEGYSRGADAYLIKPVERVELLACINNLGRRLKPAPSPEDLHFVLNTQSLSLSGPGGQVLLSHGEGQLLAALCRAAGKKLERWQAMQLVDAKEKGLVPANLEMRISALRRKLSTCGAPDDAIRTLRGVGYALCCPVQVI